MKRRCPANIARARTSEANKGISDTAAGWQAEVNLALARTHGRWRPQKGVRSQLAVYMGRNARAPDGLSIHRHHQYGNVVPLRRQWHGYANRASAEHSALWV